MSAETAKKTEGQHVLLRWAKALKNYAKQLPVAILTYEPIVSRPNTWLLPQAGGR